jgi:hypothetical protein
MTAYVIRRTTPVRAEDRRKPEDIYITMAQSVQYIGEHLTGEGH